MKLRQRLIGLGALVVLAGILLHMFRLSKLRAGK